MNYRNLSTTSAGPTISINIIIIDIIIVIVIIIVVVVDVEVVEGRARGLVKVMVDYKSIQTIKQIQIIDRAALDWSELQVYFI